MLFCAWVRKAQHDSQRQAIDLVVNRWAVKCASKDQVVHDKGDATHPFSNITLVSPRQHGRQAELRGRLRSICHRGSQQAMHLLTSSSWTTSSSIATTEMSTWARCSPSAVALWWRRMNSVRPGVDELNERRKHKMSSISGKGNVYAHAPRLLCLPS